MDWLLYGTVFILSAALIYISGEWVVASAARLARILGMREFVVAFFLMAVAASLPNFFVGITSALQGTPELSLGDIFGNNLIALTLAVVVAIYASPKKKIEASDQAVQSSAFFTMLVAILPLILLADGFLSRVDGLLLVGFFGYYTYWFFSKPEHFSEKKSVTKASPHPLIHQLRVALRDLAQVLFGIIFLLVAAYGVVTSSTFFALGLGMPLVVIGILVVGFGNALPEVYFAASSARKGETSMILGHLMGAVIFPATLVLGITVLIHPIHADNIRLITTSRISLILASLLFFLFTRSKKEISRQESHALLAVYGLFVLGLIIWG